MSLAHYPLGHTLKKLLFSGFPKASWMSNLLFRLKLPIWFFPGVEKAKAQTSDLLFPGPGKAKWFRLPICFFPGLEKAKRSDLQSSNLLFPGPETNWKPEPFCFFPAREKANW